MKIMLASCLLALSCVAGASEDTAPSPPKNGMRTITVNCAVCSKTGQLRLRPPDKGQHKGSINSKSHWDVRLACPACGGRGKRKVYRLRMDAPLENVPPCRACGWTGVERCRKCEATGLVNCRARECAGGWIIRQVPTSSGKNNRHFKTTVTPCGECGGVGKIICPQCRGMEGESCRSCNGLGKKVR